MIKLAQQCATPDGEIGSFLYADQINKVVSPVFKDTADLFAWLKANNWESYTPAGENNPYFCAYRVKQSNFYGK